MKNSKFASFIVLLGNTLELYEFMLYGVLASYISINFFPQQDSLVAMLQVYGSFAAGYIARPLGALYFGNLGDSKGRKTILAYSCIISGFATMLIGLLPSYNSIGIFATIILVMLRIIQGFAFSGEQSGALVYLHEINQDKPYKVETYYIISIFSGVLLATTLCWLISTILSKDSLVSWGWRIPFLLSFPLFLIASTVRKKFQETSQFKCYIQKGKSINMPILELFKKYSFNLIFPILYTAIYASLTSLYMVAIPSYLHLKGNFSSETIFFIESFGLLISILLFSGINKKFSNFSFVNRIMLTLLFAIISISIGLYLLSLTKPIAIFLGIVVLSISMAFVAAPLVTVISKPFPDNIKCSGVAVSFNWAVAMFTSTTPFVMLYFVEKFNNIFYMSYWYILLSMITCSSLYVFSMKNKVVKL